MKLSKKIFIIGPIAETGEEVRKDAFTEWWINVIFSVLAIPAGIIFIFMTPQKATTWQRIFELVSKFFETGGFYLICLSIIGQIIYLTTRDYNEKVKRFPYRTEIIVTSFFVVLISSFAFAIYSSGDGFTFFSYIMSIFVWLLVIILFFASLVYHKDLESGGKGTLEQQTAEAVKNLGTFMRNQP